MTDSKHSEGAGAEFHQLVDDDNDIEEHYWLGKEGCKSCCKIFFPCECCPFDTCVLAGEGADDYRTGKTKFCGWLDCTVPFDFIWQIGRLYLALFKVISIGLITTFLLAFFINCNIETLIDASRLDLTSDLKKKYVGAICCIQLFLPCCMALFVSAESYNWVLEDNSKPYWRQNYTNLENQNSGADAHSQVDAKNSGGIQEDPENIAEAENSSIRSNLNSCVWFLWDNFCLSFQFILYFIWDNPKFILYFVRDASLLALGIVAWFKTYESEYNYLFWVVYYTMYFGAAIFAVSLARALWKVLEHHQMVGRAALPYIPEPFSKGSAITCIVLLFLWIFAMIFTIQGRATATRTIWCNIVLVFVGTMSILGFPVRIYFRMKKNTGEENRAGDRNRTWNVFNIAQKYPFSLFVMIVYTIGVFYATHLFLSITANQFAQPKIADDPNTMALSDDPTTLALLQTDASIAASSVNYPICFTSWGSVLHALDFGFLANLAYSLPSHQQKADPFWKDTLENYFNASEIHWDVVHIQARHPFFAHFRTKSENPISVILIRGTHDNRDWFENVGIWSEIGALQIVNQFLPVMWWMTQKNIANYVRASSSFFSNTQVYVGNILNYVRNLNETENIYITGHSLGGGLAAIVGAKQKRQSIGFSAPGTLYLQEKFDFSVKDLRATSSVAYAYGDVVPAIDSHGGLVQMTQCGSTNSFLDCHSLKLVLCEIWQGCQSLNNTSLNDKYWRSLC